MGVLILAIGIDVFFSFNRFNNLLKEMYKNKVDAKITIKGLIELLDEVEEQYEEYEERIENKVY